MIVHCIEDCRMSIANIIIIEFFAGICSRKYSDEGFRVDQLIPARHMKDW